DEWRQVRVTEHDGTSAEFNPRPYVGRRVDDRCGGLAPPGNASSHRVTGPGPPEAEDIGGVDARQVVDRANPVHAAPGEAMRIDVVVIEDPDDVVRGLSGIDRLHSLQHIAGVPAA